MLVVFGILIVVSSLILGLIVLVQNPKGGGLSGTFGGVGNQLMGVKQTTDILEKGTWVFSAVVGVLCILSPVFISANGKGSKNNGLIEQTAAPKGTPQQAAPAPATATPQATQPAAADTNKK